MTQQLEKMVSVAVQEKDASLTKKKCRLLLIEMFGESRVEEHKEHVSAETLRLVMECQSMEAEDLSAFVDGCRSVTEEEIKALDAPPGAPDQGCRSGESGPRRRQLSRWFDELPDARPFSRRWC